jgi:ferric-dicitrate binding protein FerR (iron transport regulator)
MSTDRNDQNPVPDAESLLALAATGIRRDQADPEVVAAAAERVWEKIARQAEAPDPVIESAAVSQIRGCVDVQALLPAYLRGELSPARALLVQDHTRECVPCRRALQAARAGLGAPAAVVESAPSRFRSFAAAGRWGLAATLALAVGLGGWALWRGRTLSGPAASVASVDGELFAVGASAARPLAPGAQVNGAEGIRTAKDSGAVVRLADGSSIEMRERSEISFSDRADGTTIRLRRGNIIVQAAHQPAGKHLFVATDDCVVSVVGTVFTVNRGTKGSRVAVLEGEVRVAQGRTTNTLLPGQQLATHASLESVPLAEEVSWSRDSTHYLEVVKALQGLSRDVSQAIDSHAPRTSTALLDLMPDGTTVYIAVPNVSADLAQAREMLRQRIADSPALQAWWQQHMGLGDNEQRLDDVVSQLREFGSYLGEEVAIGLPSYAGHHDAAESELVLAEVAQPAAFPAYLEQEVAKLNAEAAQQGATAEVLRIVHDPSAESAGAGRQMYLWADNDLLAASSSLDRLRALEAVRRGATNPFLASAFHARLAQAYTDGAGWLVAVDLGTLLAGQSTDVALTNSGFADARYLVAERKESGGMTENRAVLSFGGPRHGVAAWLAAPAPMGSLDFISPEANLAAAFVVKTPTAMIDDLFAMCAANDRAFADHKSELEKSVGLDLRRDLAAPLGGEFAFALDGPMLPAPSWKLIVEVYDADALQAAIVNLLQHVNEEAAKEGKTPGRLDPESSGDRPGWALTLPGGAITIHYVYADGYLIAGPSRALVDRALQNRASGYSIAGAEQFTALLPPSGQSNFSAVVFQHLGSALAPVMSLLGGTGALTDEQKQALESLAADAPPSLAYAYGEDDRITAAMRGNGVMGLNFGTFMGLGSLFEGRPMHRVDRVLRAPRSHAVVPGTKPAAAGVGSIAP